MGIVSSAFTGPMIREGFGKIVAINPVYLHIKFGEA